MGAFGNFNMIGLFGCSCPQPRFEQSEWNFSEDSALYFQQKSTQIVQSMFAATAP